MDFPSCSSEGTVSSLYRAFGQGGFNVVFCFDQIPFLGGFRLLFCCYGVCSPPTKLQLPPQPFYRLQAIFFYYYGTFLSC